MLTKIALLGAGGKMGMRILDNLSDVSEYDVTCVEPSEERRLALVEQGATVASQADAVGAADVVIFAVPDRLMGVIAADVVPAMRSGAMAIFLDAAAPYAGILPTRDDVTYIVTHPCHPSAFNWEPDLEAHRDHFGGIAARQDAICALMQGPRGGLRARRGRNPPHLRARGERAPGDRGTGLHARAGGRGDDGRNVHRRREGSHG